MNDSFREVVLLTSCSGRIGTRLRKELAWDYRVIGLDIRRPNEDTAGADWIPCDLTDDNGIRRALSRVADVKQCARCWSKSRK